MATGTYALTSRDQVITVLGYSLEELNQGIDNEKINEHKL